jgi:hypothetical protein
MSDDNTPVPFGYKIGWLALSTTDREAVVRSLQLVDPVEVSWQTGIDAAYGIAYGVKVFITPPVDGWMLVVGWPVGMTGDDEEDIREIEQTITRLSLQFGEAQAFGTHRVVECHFWMLARNGALLRSFAIGGGELLVDAGEATAVEHEASWYPLRMVEGELEEGERPNEQDVMIVAAAWSVDPTQLGSSTSSSGRGVVATKPNPREIKQAAHRSPEHRPWWRFW